MQWLSSGRFCVILYFWIFMITRVLIYRMTVLIAFCLVHSPLTLKHDFMQ